MATFKPFLEFSTIALPHHCVYHFIPEFICSYHTSLVQVVLIHSRVALADPELLPSVRQQAKEVLLEKGVELVLGTVPESRPGSVGTRFWTCCLWVSGQKVSNLSELQLNVTQKNHEVRTERGEVLTSDLIICCTGIKVNSAAYASSFCEYKLQRYH